MRATHKWSRRTCVRAQRTVTDLVTLFALLISGTLPAQQAQLEPDHSYLPFNGFVPDSVTAIKIADAILVPIYSERDIAKERPLHAKLVGDVWSVEGTLPCGTEGACIGGVAVSEISKKDGRVLRVSHGK
jgi:hypothetical protein